MNYFSTETITSLLPEMQANLPFVGQTDVAQYVGALIVFAVLSFIFKLVQVVVLKHLKVLSAKTNTDVDDVIIDAVSGIRAWVYTLVALYLALQLFTLPTTASMILSGVVYFALVWQGIEIALCFIAYSVQRFIEKDEDGDGVVDANSASASNMITLVARILLWAFGGIFILSNMGIEVTSLIAGLGIGGVAIAFALQGILSDLFASFSIYFDKPFRIGDFITVGTDSGTVQKIGIKTTRIKTLQGEELVISNAELTTARVQNFKKMQERRGSLQFGVTYETASDKVKGINTTVEQIFESLKMGRLDRVHFTSFGDSALIFDVVFYSESAAYADFLDLQQAFNFALMDKFAKDGVEFAYPTQVVYLKNN